MESQSFNGYYAPGANPNYPYDPNGYFHNGMVYYRSPQQPNFQHYQDFNQPSPVYAPAPQQSYYGGYNQQQYAPPPQYQEQQFFQHDQNEMPSSEQRDQSPNRAWKLCSPCRAIIKKKLVPILQELGCLDQPDSHENSDQPSTGATVKEGDKSVAATLITKVVQPLSGEENEVGVGVLEAAIQDIVPQQQKNTRANYKVEERKNQRSVAANELEFNIQQIEFGYTPDSSVDITPSSPGLSIEEVVGFNEYEYAEDFPSLSCNSIDTKNTLGTDTISKTMKKKLKREKHVGTKEQDAEKQESAVPPTARKHQRKPKRLITLSDICGVSDVPTNQPSTSNNSSSNLIMVNQLHNGNAKVVLLKSNNARASSEGHAIGYGTFEINGKKPSAVSEFQKQYGLSPLSVPFNSNALKPSVKSVKNVTVPPKQDTVVEKRAMFLHKGPKYMSKAERKQLNEKKVRKQLLTIPEELAPAPTESHSIDDNTENVPSSLTEENSSDEVDVVSVNSQKSEIDKDQEAQTPQKVKEASTENSNPDECNLGDSENDPQLSMNMNRTDQDVVLSAKDRRLKFNANLRKQKKAGKESLIEKGEDESSNVLLPLTNSTTSTNGPEAETTSDATMSNIESTSSALLMPLSTHEDIPNCKNMDLDVSQTMRMYWDAIKKFRYTYLAFNVPNVELELYKDDTTNLGMQIFQKLQQTPVIDCRITYYKENHSALLKKRIESCQQVNNDDGRTLKIFERCQCEKNNISLQDIAALNSLGLSNEHVNKYYPVMVSAIAKKYARKELGAYEITPEYIKKYVETGFDEKYLVHYCNYVNRQLRARYFNAPTVMENHEETRLSGAVQVSKNEKASQLLQCSQQRCKVVFRGLTQTLKKKGFKQAASLCDFLRKTNSMIITMDYFNARKIRDNPDFANLLGIWFGYQEND